MALRIYDETLDQEMNQYRSYLLICFDTDDDASFAAKEIGKEYDCIIVKSKYRGDLINNVFIPVSNNSKQLFNYDYARDFCRNICKKYRGKGFEMCVEDVDWDTGEPIGWLSIYDSNGRRL